MTGVEKSCDSFSVGRAGETKKASKATTTTRLIWRILILPAARQCRAATFAAEASIYGMFLTTDTTASLSIEVLPDV
jgi:hypothetical protein